MWWWILCCDECVRMCWFVNNACVFWYVLLPVLACVRACVRMCVSLYMSNILSKIGNSHLLDLTSFAQISWVWQMESSLSFSVSLYPSVPLFHCVLVSAVKSESVCLILLIHYTIFHHGHSIWAWQTHTHIERDPTLNDDDNGDRALYLGKRTLTDIHASDISRS